MRNTANVPSITDSLVNAATRATALAAEADSGQTAELALIVARIAHEAAAISRLALDNKPDPATPNVQKGGD